LKPKSAFESGNSPPKVSENGSPIQTGRGLESVCREIAERFEKARSQYPVQPQGPVQEPPQAPQQVVYTEQHETRFHQRAKRLSLAALESSHISTRPRRADVGCWEISVPSQSVEELIKEALGE
jgi:hypothetical protein